MHIYIFEHIFQFPSLKLFLVYVYILKTISSLYILLKVTATGLKPTTT